MTALDGLEWAGAILGMIGGWLVSSGDRPKVRRGFWVWLVSNAALITWAVILHRYGIALMMSYYSITSVRGIINHGGSRG